MAQLVLGPMLRYADATSAVVWVETDEPCKVEVLGASAATFALHGHHFGVVELTDLEPGSSEEYTVRVGGEQVWPEPDSEFRPAESAPSTPRRRYGCIWLLPDERAARCAAQPSARVRCAALLRERAARHRRAGLVDGADLARRPGLRGLTAASRAGLRPRAAWR